MKMNASPTANWDVVSLEKSQLQSHSDKSNASSFSYMAWLYEKDICSNTYLFNDLSGERWIFYERHGYATSSLSNSAPPSLKANELNKDDEDQ